MPAGKNELFSGKLRRGMGLCKMLEIIKQPQHEDCKSYIEWLGDEFDAQHFDKDAVNQGLQDMRSFALPENKPHETASRKEHIFIDRTGGISADFRFSRDRFIAMSCRRKDS